MSQISDAPRRPIWTGLVQGETRGRIYSDGADDETGRHHGPKSVYDDGTNRNPVVGLKHELWNQTLAAGFRMQATGE